jgi:two-component system chemotaxis response regulator CheY
MAEPTVNGPRVLVVDDSIVVRQILSFTVRQIPEFFRATVDEAGNGAIALKKIQTTRYDLVLSDIRMPYLDGLELVHKVRHEIGDTTTPIVLVSTLGSEQDVQRGLEAGATAYVIKPLSPHDIKTALQKILKSRDGG